MDINRVKFFPSDNLAFGLNLHKIEHLEIPKFENITADDAIEFNEIYKYINNGIQYSTWTMEEKQLFWDKSKRLHSLSMRYFSSISDQNIISIYNSIDINYCDRFWDMFEECKLFNKISPSVFNNLISCDHINPYDLFKHKHTVEKYGNILRSYILDNLFLVPIVIYWYEQDFNEKVKLYRPVQFTGQDVCNYFNNYIKSKQTNLNYLKSIQLMRTSKNFPITDELRLDAKREYLRLGDELSKTGVSTNLNISILFSESQKENVKSFNIGPKRIYSYSKKFLLNNLDYYNILENFKNIFDFVDNPQIRWNCVSRLEEESIIERTLSNKLSNIYPCYSIFRAKNCIADSKLFSYYNFLKQNNIMLEEVLKWFFTQHLQTTFGCSEIKVDFPINDMPYSQKCSILATSIESILRQLKLFICNGNIDFELLGMSTKPIKFNDIPSNVSNKYIYGTEDTFKRITHLLFSNQSPLAFNKRVYEFNKQYNSFYDVLTNNEIFSSDYSPNDSLLFKELENINTIHVLENKRIIIKDKNRIELLKDLFYNNVISRWHYTGEYQITIERMLNDNLIELESTLFSKPEINFLNYILNRSEYDNGLELRNKYLHGIFQVNSNDEIHRCNYFILLRVLLLISLKIKDDFELNELLSD